MHSPIWGLQEPLFPRRIRYGVGTDGTLAIVPQPPAGSASPAQCWWPGVAESQEIRPGHIPH